MFICMLRISSISSKPLTLDVLRITRSRDLDPLAWRLDFVKADVFCLSCNDARIV